MRVELLHHHGCRFAQATYLLVQECLVALGIPTEVLVRVGEYPSPTVLINGTDVMRPTEELTEVRMCRIDMPTRDQLLATLRVQLAAESREA